MTVMHRGNPIQIGGTFLKPGATAPDFKLVDRDLKEVTLKDFGRQRKILNIYPSVDTPVCATSTRKFNEKASSLKDTVVICIAADLPFAFTRFCGAEGLDRVRTLSTFRSPGFATDYGVRIDSGLLVGLCARACLVLDGNNKVLHAEMVPEIAQEPNYDAALKALQ